MTNKTHLEAVTKKSLDFENTLVDIRKRSEKRAWIVATTSCFISVCLIGGLFYILPLKEKVPYLVMADAYTGQASVSKLIGDWNNNSITKYEAINKSNISHFVIARESFDRHLIYDNDWPTVFAMSAENISSAYRNFMNMGNKQSPFNIYGQDQAVRVKILSIVLNNNGAKGAGESIATVRFQRYLFMKSTGSMKHIDSNIATLTFKYKDNLKMSEKYRIINPLGFQVTSYRVDPDTTVPIAPSISGQENLGQNAPDLNNETEYVESFATSSPIAASKPN